MLGEVHTAATAAHAAAAGKDYLSPLPALVPWGKLLGRRKGAFGKLNSG